MSARYAWYVDEDDLSGIDATTFDEVAAYEVRQGFDPTGEIVRLQQLGLGPGTTLVEFGPGPGGFALAAARTGAEVIAVDPAPAMVAYIDHKVATEGITGLRTVHAGFLTYEHIGAPVDLVFTRNALHQLPDFWKMEALLRIATILRPGGVLRLRDLIWSFPPERSAEHLEAWFREADERASGWQRDGLEAHVREEFSTYTWLLEAMLDRAGFEVEDADTSANAIFADYTCRRR